MNHSASLPKAPLQHRWRNWLLTIITLAIIVWSFTGMPSLEIKPNAWVVTKSIAAGLAHPDFSYVWTGDGEDLTSTLLQTLGIAFLGTFISAIISLP